MNRKTLSVLMLSLIALGTTSTNADDIKQWIQENGLSSKMAGAQTAGITAATSLSLGAFLAKIDQSVSENLSQQADMNRSSTFRKAAEPYILWRNDSLRAMAPYVEKLKNSQAQLDKLTQKGKGSSEEALGLQRKIKNLQSLIEPLELQRRKFQDKIDDAHKYLASGGKAETRLSGYERENLDRFVDHYQRELKISALLRKEAADGEKRAEKSFMGGVKGMLLGIPVGIGVTLVDEKLRERSIASETDKVQAEPHSSTVNRSPAVLGPANAEAK